jgi:hypothetical protein
MPVTGRGKVKRTRTIHPPGRPDVYLHVDVVSKKGPRGGTTVAGPIHHMNGDDEHHKGRNHHGKI